MFYKNEYAYLYQLKTNLSYRSRVDADTNEYIDQGLVDRILKSVFELEHTNYESLPHSWNPPKLCKENIDQIIERYHRTVKFHQLKECEWFDNTLQCHLKSIQELRSLTPSSFVLIRHELKDEENPFYEDEGGTLFLVDQLNLKVWFVNPEIIHHLPSNSLSPLLCHSLSEELRHRELSVSINELPDEVLEQAGQPVPKQIIISHDQEAEDADGDGWIDDEEHSCSEVYTPLACVRYNQLYPLPIGINEYTSQEMFYIGGFPALCLMGNWVPDSLMSELQQGLPVYEVQDSNWHSHSNILSMTGYLASMLAQHGAPSLTPNSSALEATLFRMGHQVTEIASASSLLASFNCMSFSFEGDQLSFGLYVPKLIDITNKVGIQNRLPVDLVDSGNSLVSLLPNGSEIMFHPTYQPEADNGYHYTGSSVSPRFSAGSCQSQVYLVSGVIDGVRRYFQGVTGVYLSHYVDAVGYLKEILEDIQPDHLFAWFMGLSDEGLDEQGNIVIPDPFDYKLLQRPHGSFIVPNHALINDTSISNGIIGPSNILFDHLQFKDGFDKYDLRREWSSEISRIESELDSEGFSPMSIRLQLQKTLECIKDKTLFSNDLDELKKILFSKLTNTQIRENISQMSFDYYHTLEHETCIESSAIPVGFQSQFQLGVALFLDGKFSPD